MIVLHGCGEADVDQLVFPDAGHRMMEEQSTATVASVRAVLDGKSRV